MQHATATLTHLPASQLAAAMRVADLVNPNFSLTHWKHTSCGTYHLYVTVPGHGNPQHALGVAKRIASAWAEAGFCCNGRTSSGAALKGE